MKKIILFMFTTGLLYAQTESDIAITAGYNKFDDPEYLRDHRAFYGVRGGVYQDNGYGFQLGYEQANGANCQGLDLKRFYTNALLQSTQEGKLKPYGLLSLGYETSNIHEHKPDQTFIGAGVGARYDLAQNVNGFIETRLLRKLKSDDTDIITTIGLAYVLNGNNILKSTKQRVVYTPIVQPEVSIPVVAESRYEQRTQAVSTYVEPYRQRVVVETPKDYYVQLGAFASTNPDVYVKKLYSKGIDDVQVKQIVRGGINLSLVVVGPFYDKKDASRNLHRLKRVNRGAFVTKL